MSKTINVEVVYGLPKKQSLLSFKVAADACVLDAIELSGIQKIHPDIDLKENKVGVWNRACKLTDSLKEGDRVEIYRPLIADPKEVRKRRAEKAKEEGRADKVTGGRPNPMKAAKTDIND
ncbi:RnfH family protein [Glaciecola sp.]|jgi:putative ubiquitin-RnfH superfamily antitoxin RatB of RatAB toxin-antitoxin module|uniref:RnfH family protein n=1 Tax=Glaciecola sp. MF2-115 TaxID=3384827 RepID=UPI00398A3E0B|mmetsp:Transcript_3797/g.12063  ORF Transcript_3797/g.12063 Transcript_3797/m.12063 type:complete len:120 (-) Transcript_3797:83-442(-)